MNIEMSFNAAVSSVVVSISGGWMHVPLLIIHSSRPGPGKRRECTVQ